MRTLQRLITLGFFACATAFGQPDYKSLTSEAQAHLKTKDYQKAVDAFAAAFKAGDPHQSDLYDAACSAALAGDSKLALIWLRLAVDKGWSNARLSSSDPDLKSLRELQEWKQLIVEMEKKQEAIDAADDNALRRTLLAILDDDQKHRMQIDEIEKKFGRDSPELRELWKVINAKDQINQSKVNVILDQHGWLGVDEVGSDANQALFLVIQHSDLKTQQHYLPMMRTAVQERKASASSLAYLEDRVALGEGRRQIYGSQIMRDNKTGKYDVSPLEDPINVDQRRAAVGLGPLADYVKHWDIAWDPVAHQKQLEMPEAEKTK